MSSDVRAMSTIRRAQRAAMVTLFCNGLLYATWGVSIPTIQQTFALSEAMLSLAMACVAIGGIVTMKRAGQWIARCGSGSVCTISGVFMALTIAPLLLISHYPSLLVLLLAFGIATATNDVAANAQVAYLERVASRSLIGAVHGSFSIGGLVGALLASSWSLSSLPALTHLLLVAAGVLLLTGYVAHHLQNESVSGKRVHDTTIASCQIGSQRPVAHHQIQRRLSLFGVLAFAALIVEGAVYDWAAVYMKEVIVAPTLWCGLSYAAFALAMALGRIYGDSLRERYRHQQVVTFSGLLAVAGIALTLASHHPALALCGFLIIGLGLSNFIPLLFSSASQLCAHVAWPAAQGLAVTTRIAYFGLLVGPLLIGPLAQWVGLRGSLLSLMAVIIAICTGWLALSRKSAGTPWQLLPPQSRH